MIFIIGEGGGGAVRFKKKKKGSNFGRKTYLGQSKFCVTTLRIVIYTNKKTGPRRERKIISRPGNIFHPPPPLKIHLFIYLSILGQFTSLLRSFSSYETSQSVGVVKTGEPREKKEKKKKTLAYLQAELVSHEPTTNTVVRRSNETR